MFSLVWSYYDTVVTFSIVRSYILFWGGPSVVTYYLTFWWVILAVIFQFYHDCLDYFVKYPKYFHLFHQFTSKLCQLKPWLCKELSLWGLGQLNLALLHDFKTTPFRNTDIVQSQIQFSHINWSVPKDLTSQSHKTKRYKKYKICFDFFWKWGIKNYLVIWSNKSPHVALFYPNISPQFLVLILQSKICIFG